MQNSPFYYNKAVISQIPEEKVLQSYNDVTFQEKNLTVVQLNLQVTTHRLIFNSNSVHCFIINGERINDLGISQSGFLWGKQYSIKIHTKLGQKIKIYLSNFKEAQIIIQNMMKRQQWTKKPQSKYEKESGIYSGMMNKIQNQRKQIMKNQQKVNTSFSSFDSLFANLRQLKQIMGEIRTSTNSSNGENPQINKILKDIGFVSVISKQQSGRQYYKQLANDLFQICEKSLFKIYGGMVSVLDLFYFYNKKRQFNLVSPEEILKACQQFQKFGYGAKLTEYQNNIKMVQSSTFDPDKDFEQHFMRYFDSYKEGHSVEEISKKKGMPLVIIEVKLKNAAKRGKLVIDDRIQGTKYYRNLFLEIGKK